MTRRKEKTKREQELADKLKAQRHLKRVINSTKAKGITAEHAWELALRPSSPLSGRLKTHDPQEALKKQQESEMRKFIRDSKDVFTVTGVSGKRKTQEKKEARVFLSLTEDRATTKYYRATENVLKSRPQRRELIRDALKDIDTYINRFACLGELNPLRKQLQKLTLKYRGAVR